MKMRVFLADDHQIFRDALRPLIHREPDFEVVGEASDGLETTRQVHELKPDVVIMDISMPNLNGLEATRKILADLPNTRIIILSMHSDRRYVVEALKTGACGYLLKDSAFEDLKTAIHTVAKGKIYLSPAISTFVVQDYIQMTRQEESSVFEVLSQREREVLQQLAEGLSTREIAEKLNVSVKTIETHRKQIMDKLDIRTVAGLTKYAVREGLTDL